MRGVEKEGSDVNGAHSHGEAWRGWWERWRGILSRFCYQLRCLQDGPGEVTPESSAYVSPQVLLPPALCLPRRSRLEGEASAGPR